MSFSFDIQNASTLATLFITIPNASMSAHSGRLLEDHPNDSVQHLATPLQVNRRHIQHRPAISSLLQIGGENRGVRRRAEILLSPCFLRSYFLYRFFGDDVLHSTPTDGITVS